MKLPRRKFLHLAAGAALLPAWPRVALSLDYPTRPVRLIVPFPPGGAPDISGRLMGQWLSQRLGQQFVIDNRSGAGGNIGTEAVATASPDGYTLLWATSTTAVNATVYDNLNFSFPRDFVPVGFVGTTPFVMAVTPSFPATTVPEFVAYAKANPGKINMGSQGVGTTPHLCGEMLKMMTGIDLVHVPYRGNLMPDLLAGQVQFYFTPLPQAIAYLTDGRLRALAVTTPMRVAALPDVPTMGESLPGFVAVGWFGMCAPRGTPDTIVAALNAEIASGIADSDFKARLRSLGVEPKAMTAAEFGHFIADEIAKWAKVVKFAGIKLK